MNIQRRGTHWTAVVLFAQLALTPIARAQEPAMHAGQLAHAVDRLANTGRVLYIAAHPDDENTRLLAYLANARHLTVGYLSMTRGGGGQNLIGTEQAELLGVIRTEELLSARRLDGAQQFFTHVRDFGYSKSAEETLATWGREEALADVVRVIRTFQPDVIITRFNETPPNHGHHIASAILAREAFEAAADSERFPHQLKDDIRTWQTDRLLYNWSQWRGGPPPDGSVVLDVGAYDTRLGVGYGELAAISRSQHKSQGFGVAGARGEILEYFVPVAGTQVTDNLLEGIDVSWRRFGKPGTHVATALEEAAAFLDRDHPERALPALLKADGALAALPDSSRATDARASLHEIVAKALGLFARATAAQPVAVPGTSVPMTLEVVLRRPASVTLRNVSFLGSPVDVKEALQLDERKEVSRSVAIPETQAISTPFWLAESPLAGRYVGDDFLASPPTVLVELGIDDQIVRLARPVEYTWTDRVHGERARAFLIAPPATVTPSRQAIMLPNGQHGTVLLRVRAGQDDLTGQVTLPLPTGWSVQPAQAPVHLTRVGDETVVRFAVTPPSMANAIDVRPTIEVAGKRWSSYREDVIDYPHIPMQVVLQPATLRLAPIELRLPTGTFGYIPGSGDTLAEDLAHVGLNVETLDDSTIRSGDLSRYAAIIVGIRAYNTRDVLRTAHERLMSYVENGGTVVVQYNTSSDRDPLQIPVGPFPLTIGRDRVTDENAVMTPVDPQAPILQSPNLIAAADFANWVQERGLYFANTWDDRYQPIFRVADPDEEPLLGSTLVARFGEGKYVYTGLAFFRQLPAGVPGAYRLLANLIAK
jgi:LmbE family N-acetylglucosaminyl deacetylase